MGWPTTCLTRSDSILSEARALGERKQALWETCGFAGLFPLDGEAMTAPTIYRSNMARLRSADLLTANLTPLRGSAIAARCSNSPSTLRSPANGALPSEN